MLLFLAMVAAGDNFSCKFLSRCDRLRNLDESKREKEEEEEEEEEEKEKSRKRTSRITSEQQTTRQSRRSRRERAYGGERKKENWRELARNAAREHTRQNAVKVGRSLVFQEQSHI